jgi:uncharacterized protein (TIGR02996 family)
MTTTHDTERAFIAGALARPGDAAPWLVFADWLEERQDRRAAYVRRYLRHLQWLTCTAGVNDRIARAVKVAPGHFLWLCDWRPEGFRFVVLANPPPLPVARFAPKGM